MRPLSASVCRKKATRHPGSRESLFAALDLLPDLQIQEIDVAPDVLAELALEADLSVHDAAYLFLALGEEAELVTLDRRLERVWRGAEAS